MKLLSLQEAWQLFLESPTRASFAALRELVVSDDEYAPAAFKLAELTDLLQRNAFREVQRLADELMPAWALCPRIHFLAGCAAEALGDAEEVELCRFLSTTCVDGIVASGEGTRSNPWLVTYPSDAQDCLTRLGTSMVSQQLMDRGDLLLDVIVAADGKSYCFDVTEMVAAGVEPSELTSAAKA